LKPIDDKVKQYFVGYEVEEKMEKDNLKIYNSVREVPKEAQKSIKAGRLKGMTDINPMWRIKTLTEQFGPIGLGWYYKITDKRLEAGCLEQISAFVDIELFVKYGDEWSKGIQGTGGSSFVTKESKGLHQSDECFKMALTDAISVACKALGVGANVYWNKDRTKYTKTSSEPLAQTKIKALYTLAGAKGKSSEDVKALIKKNLNIDSTKDLTLDQYNTMVKWLRGKPDKEVTK